MLFFRTLACLLMLVLFASAAHAGNGMGELFTHEFQRDLQKTTGAFECPFRLESCQALFTPSVRGRQFSSAPELLNAAQTCLSKNLNTEVPAPSLMQFDSGHPEKYLFSPDLHFTDQRGASYRVECEIARSESTCGAITCNMTSDPKWFPPVWIEKTRDCEVVQSATPERINKAFAACAQRNFGVPAGGMAPGVQLDGYIAARSIGPLPDDKIDPSFLLQFRCCQVKSTTGAIGVACGKQGYGIEPSEFSCPDIAIGGADKMAEALPQINQCIQAHGFLPDEDPAEHRQNEPRAGFSIDYVDTITPDGCAVSALKAGNPKLSAYVTCMCGQGSD